MDTQLPLRQALVIVVLNMRPKKSKDRSTKQVEGAPPVVENAKLPKMTEKQATSLKRIRRKILRMPVDPAQDKGGRNRMDPVSTRPNTVIEEATPTTTTSHEYPTQEEITGKEKRSLKQKPEAYLRLRLHVENSEISIVEARKVEGPLTMPEKIEGNLAYEVTIGSNRIASESIPDVGVNRSFPNPQGVPGQEGHLFVEVPSYEFNVRIPEESLSPSALPKADIAVYRVKTPVSQSIVSDIPLRSQFAGELREVARLKGIHVKKLPKSMQSEINRLFR